MKDVWEGMTITKVGDDLELHMNRRQLKLFLELLAPHVENPAIASVFKRGWDLLHPPKKRPAKKSKGTR